MAKKATAKTDHASTGSKDYTVLARRYRPQQFDDLIGQEAVSQALKNAIKTGRIAHAYLFTGVRGVGKTSTARILAKALNCVKGPTVSPCDECSACKAIAVGEDIDVLEIDGASNNKVEEVRELRQNTQYRPQQSRFKIYIIDEVHMLSTSAFNALLKTLEEPPPHVKFIFATTEVNKIPITILSRCQRYDLGGISRDAIKQRLQSILKEEEKTAEDEAIGLIARRASGSMRDAQSLLDQVLAFAQGKITLDQVQNLLGLAKEDQILGIVQPILQRDAATALASLHECLNKGVQIAELLDQWIDLWRQLLLRSTLGNSPAAKELLDTDLSPFAESLASWTTESLMAGLDVLVTTKTRLRSTGHTQVLLELALIRLCRLSDLLPLAEVARRLDGLAKGAGRGTPMPAASRVTAPAEPARQIAASPVTTPPLKKNYSLNKPEELWPDLLDALGNNSQHRFQLEKAIRRTVVPPAGLIIGFPQGCEPEKEFCADSTRSVKLEDTLKKMTGQQVAVRFEMVQDSVAEKKGPPRAQQTKQALQQMPLAKAIMDELGGQLVYMDEGFGSGAVDCGPIE